MWGSPVAAVSVGLVAARRPDLCYQEDARAGVDLNVVMNGAGEFIEVQGTAEAAFSEARLSRLLALARRGIAELQAVQRRALVHRDHDEQGAFR